MILHFSCEYSLSLFFVFAYLRQRICKITLRISTYIHMYVCKYMVCICIYACKYTDMFVLACRNTVLPITSNIHCHLLALMLWLQPHYTRSNTHAAIAAAAFVEWMLCFFCCCQFACRLRFVALAFLWCLPLAEWMLFAVIMIVVNIIVVVIIYFFQQALCGLWKSVDCAFERLFVQSFADSLPQMQLKQSCRLSDSSFQRLQWLHTSRHA